VYLINEINYHEEHNYSWKHVNNSAIGIQE
jgi:hypothetical protein